MHHIMIYQIELRDIYLSLSYTCTSFEFNCDSLSPTHCGEININIMSKDNYLI